ncbi:MAG: hypothetical protein ACI8W7_001145 [Gammaproteobacteria bacterium]|jgi:hypothetical protein
MNNFDSKQAWPWRTFLVYMCTSCLALLGTVAVFIVIMDPHDHVFFSPPFARAPINTNQRFSYPALARSDRFDSLVIGTSTIRLLNPTLLNEALGGQFVNLAMNSATAYEQRKIHTLFMRQHQHARTLLVGIDKVWCDANEIAERYTRRPFPEWLYDEHRWNDLPHMLNSATLEQAVRQLQYQLGSREPRYGFDGYRHFLPPLADYDLGKARQHIYGGEGSVRERSGAAVQVGDDLRRRWPFPALQDLQRLLAAMPMSARKVLLFVPYHLYIQPLPSTLAGQHMMECKRRVAAIARTLPNTTVLDFMIDSAVTRDDRNYWDALHYTQAIADELVGHIKDGVNDRHGTADMFEFL